MNKPHHPTKTEEIKNLKLLAAILIDLIGMASYILPGVSELIDAIWAPISAFLVYFLFNRKLSWATLTFFEELIPFTDVVPSATIAWYFYYHNSNEKSTHY